MTDVAHAAMRGVVAAAAMTGMRALTVDLGLVRQAPPDAVVESGRLLDRVPARRRRAAIETVHWLYGAQGGAVFGMLPEAVRRLPMAGPAYGLGLWLVFELGVAPVLGLRHAEDPRPVEKAALAADHALYGFVLSELRSRPQG